MVIGESGCVGQGNIGRVAVDNISLAGLFQAFPEIQVPEDGLFCCGQKQFHFLSREVGSDVAAKGGIEFTAPVVPYKTVITVPVQVQEERGFPAAVYGVIEIIS